MESDSRGFFHNCYSRKSYRYRNISAYNLRDIVQIDAKSTHKERYLRLWSDKFNHTRCFIYSVVLIAKRNDTF